MATKKNKIITEEPDFKYHPKIVAYRKKQGNPVVE